MLGRRWDSRGKAESSHVSEVFSGTLRQIGDARVREIVIRYQRMLN
jgi:hypothetical protein